MAATIPDGRHQGPRALGWSAHGPMRTTMSDEEKIHLQNIAELLILVASTTLDAAERILSLSSAQIPGTQAGEHPTRHLLQIH